MEKTLSIIKPNAVEKGVIGNIINRFENNKLRVVAIKSVWLNRYEVESFYSIHRDKPFFRGLVDFMSSGPVVAIVLEGESAVTKNRELMGSTDPEHAKEGTIRYDFADNVTMNAVHGSDSAENAEREIAFFFSKKELF